MEISSLKMVDSNFVESFCGVFIACLVFVFQLTNGLSMNTEQMISLVMDVHDLMTCKRKIGNWHFEQNYALKMTPGSFELVTNILDYVLLIQVS